MIAWGRFLFAVVQFAQFLATLMRDKELRNEGRRDQALKNVTAGLKGLREDAKTDAKVFSRGDLYNRLHTRVAPADTESESADGVAEQPRAGQD